MAKHKPLLFTNATIHTSDDVQPRAEWISVLGSRIQRIGNGKAPPIDQVIDLAGRTVVPGFVDAHAHFFQTGVDLLFLDMSGVSSLAEIGARLEQAAGGPRTWIFAHSFEEDDVADVRFVTRDHLDELEPTRPVWMNRVDYHSAVVNSAALARLHIPIGMPGLLLEKGRPNGIVRSEAYFYARAKIGQLYPQEVKEGAIKEATRRFVSRGITAVHALEGGRLFGDEGVGMVLRRMDQLPIDVTLFLQEKNIFYTTRLGFRHLGGCVLIDGSIGSYTAALDEDYAGMPGWRGHLYEKQRDFSRFVEEAHRAGVQLAFHAIGPRAIDMVLTAYERAQERFPRYNHRHRIEHFEMATDEQIHRACELEVVVCMQPAFEYFWGGPEGMYAKRLGEGWRRTNRLRSILDAGVRIAGGTDANVTPPDPMLAIHAAVNHPNPEQRLTPAEALKIMTVVPAYAAFNEERHGSLVMGKEASFVVLGDDPLTVPPEKIKDVPVLETWSRGKRVFHVGEGGERRFRMRR